jgi:hypothetical protein
MIRFIYSGETYEYDDDTLLLSEAMELQKQSGQTSGQLETLAQAGDVMGLAAFMWVAIVREDAQHAGVAFRDAARAMPFADWDPNIKELMGSLKRVEEPENPTEPTRSPDDPTSPGTSATSSDPTPSAENATASSDSSPTT